MLKHLLVPLDESEIAERALVYARQIVQSDGKITFIAVIDVPAFPYMITPGPYPVPIEGGVEDYDRMVREMTEKARAYLHRVADPLTLEGLTTGIRVVTGNPAECILETAHELDVDAIVMSTHGRSGLSRWVFGSVTQKVLSGVNCPVLVVPPPRS